MSSYKDYTARLRRKRAGAGAMVLVMLLVISMLTIALAYVASRMLTGRPLFDPVSIGGTVITTPGVGTNIGADTGLTPPLTEEIFGQQLERTWNTLSELPKTTNTEVHSANATMLALPANGRVSREYFKTSLFIGDSIAQGMWLYTDGLRNEGTAVAAFKGTSPRQIVQNAVGKLPDGTEVPMLEYIQKQTPTSVYVGLGTNALIGETDEAFQKFYGDLLDVVQQTFPNVPIYVQSILPVTAKISQDNKKLDNDRIRMMNNAIALMALDRNMHYINLHEVLADDTGALREEIAGKDGMHLWSAPVNTGYRDWVDYLQTHTVPNVNNEPFLEQPYNS